MTPRFLLILLLTGAAALAGATSGLTAWPVGVPPYVLIGDAAALVGGSWLISRILS